MTEQDQDILDVAIVGGGVSGVYSAMRLLGSERSEHSPLPDRKLSVGVFEQSNRIGGRLLSLQPPGVPNTRVEVGGMRYTSEHKHVIGLVGLFDLTPVDFTVTEPQNIAYLRNTRLRMQDLDDASKLPYNLTGSERDKSVLDKGFTAVAAERMLRTMTGKDVDLAKVNWLEIAEELDFEGDNLSNLPLRYLMQRMISHEAYQFAVDSSGYDSILYTWNGADGFPWNLADFGKAVKFFRLAEGYQEVPLKCADAVTKAGGEVHMEHRLVSFDTVKLENDSEIVEFVVDDGKEHVTRRARNLVLAMPRRSLELLEPTGKVMKPDNTAVRNLMESVTPIPLFKLALCYSYAWWETLPAVNVKGDDGCPAMKKITKGESVTDLPVRQLYYWDTDPKTGNAVVLIYDDGLALTYWAGLRDHEETFKGLEGSEAPGGGLSAWSDFPAPKRMVDEVHRQIMEMHGVSGEPQIPAPYAASFQDWGEDPYGGGANFWHVGVRSHDVSREIVQPVKKTPVFICGESYSHAQGWVEGALATAEDMLQHHMGLMPPRWEGQD